VARRLGSALPFHPLNRPRVDPVYSAIQAALRHATRSPRSEFAESRFCRHLFGNTGIDPYTTAVSDVYQDLFAEGNYTGKVFMTLTL